jgi:hypothetical protein
MIPSDKSPEMTATLERLFGRSTHIKNGTCTTCGGDAKIFSDNLSLKEYTISGMCQKCQDSFFDSSED